MQQDSFDQDMPEYEYTAYEASTSSPDETVENDTHMPPFHHTERHAWQRKYTLVLYAITSILLFADQNLLAPNLSQAAEEFGFSDDVRDKRLGGDIALAFFLLGAPASFVIGCCADTDSFSRSTLFGITVLIGEGACFCTYFTSTYLGLYITRALTGFSVGGALPLLSSVLGDWFKPEERGKVMATVGIGTGLGIALGQGISGFVGPIYGWRAPFLVVSIPALFIAVLVTFTVIDPPRGGSESFIATNNTRTSNEGWLDPEESSVEAVVNISSDHEIAMVRLKNETSKSPSQRISSGVGEQILSLESDGRNKWMISNPLRSLAHSSFHLQHLKTAKMLLSSRTVLLTMIQGAPGCVPWGIVNTFLNDYLANDCGLSVQRATGVILLFGLGNFVGICLGGLGGDFLYKLNPRYPSILSGVSAIITCVPMWMLINLAKVDGVRSLSQSLMLGVFSVCAGIGSGITGPIVKSTLQNVTLPHTRGQAFALLNTFDDFGRGLGPVFVAALIVQLESRQVAFNVGILGWIVCGIFNTLIYFTLDEDVRRMRTEFSERYSTLAQSDGDSI